MKRLIAWMLLLMVLPVGPAFAKEKDWTIKELYDLYQGQRWQGEYAKTAICFFHNEHIAGFS